VWASWLLLLWHLADYSLYRIGLFYRMCLVALRLCNHELQELASFAYAILQKLPQSLMDYLGKYQQDGLCFFLGH
jgi:hypothetical protein